MENLEELRQALDEGTVNILADDFSLDEMRQAVALTAGQAVLEVSGGVDRPRRCARLTSRCASLAELRYLPLVYLP